MTLACCQDHVLTEIRWFVWSKTSYSIDERRCYRCGTNNRTVKIELLSQWKLEAEFRNLGNARKKICPKNVPQKTVPKTFPKSIPKSVPKKCPRKSLPKMSKKKCSIKCKKCPKYSQVQRSAARNSHCDFCGATAISDGLFSQFLM